MKRCLNVFIRCLKVFKFEIIILAMPLESVLIRSINQDKNELWKLNLSVMFIIFLIGADPGEGKTSIAETQPNVCYMYWGRKAKTRSVHSCKSDEQNKSRCPCVSNQRMCTRKCRCFNCMNRVDTSGLKADQKCRCGEFNQNKADRSKIQSCADIPGARKRTKCPCYAQKQPCTAKCSCHNCGNEHGKRESQSSVTVEKRREKCTSSPSSVKRNRSTAYHRENCLDVKQSSWTLQETCIVDSVESFLLSTSIIPSAHNVTVLYNYVVSSSSAFSNYSRARYKTMDQVVGKLEYCQKRQDALKKCCMELLFYVKQQELKFWEKQLVEVLKKRVKSRHWFQILKGIFSLSLRSVWH